MTKADYIKANKPLLNIGLTLYRHKTKKDQDGDALYKVFGTKPGKRAEKFGWQPVSADEPVGVEKKAEPSVSEATQESGIAEANATPSALELMYENNIEPATVTGSGKDGKILKKEP